MGYKNATGGLNFQYPDQGEENWYAVFEQMLLLISSHSHSGAPNGAQIGTAGLQNDSADDTKVRLRNAQWLRARNAAGSADVNILRLASSDKLEFLDAVVEPIAYTPTFTALAPMTVFSQTINSAHYLPIGKWRFLEIDATINLAAPASYEIRFTLPHQARTGSFKVFAGSILKPGAYIRGASVLLNGTTTGTLYLDNSGSFVNFETATNLNVIISGMFLSQ